MKAFLMFKNQDFDMQMKLPANKQDLIQDMELDTLFKAMACGDKFIFAASQQAVLSCLGNLDTILYRQNILKDCLKNAAIVIEVYNNSVDSIKREKRHYWGLLTKSPDAVLDRSLDDLQIYMEILNNLKIIANKHAHKFDSEGFTKLFAMLQKELGEEFITSVQTHLRELKFKEGILISAELGKGNKGNNYVLRKHKSPEKKHGWRRWAFPPKPPAYAYYISDRDEGGLRALSELKNRGISLVANVLAQSSDHILSFFTMLRTELAFYMGCLNLYEQLAQKGEPISFPLPMESSERSHSFKGLYDVCLALTIKEKVVDNDMDADHKDLVIITGANQGGKSTFLRSIGLSQLMMQCGMFVPAKYFCSNVSNGLFTHFKREEDAAMDSGKLDEELSRMSDIADNLTPDSMVLFNESFAATNEREGSEIARQIICALLEKHIKVFFVTHLYDFAYGFYDKKIESAIFLRAERQTDGRRTFKIIEGEPLQTSYGEDLYNRIIGTDN